MRIGKHPTVTSDRQCLKIRGKEKTKHSRKRSKLARRLWKVTGKYRFESCSDYNDRILICTK
jgi:muconolactone delta-isomerase